jgi:hypothetical protein
MNMKSTLAMCATALLVACAPLQHAPAPRASLAEDVAAFLSDYLAAMAARDAGKIRQAFVADERLAWLEDGKVRYRSVDEVVASLAALPAGAALRTELKDLRVVQVSQTAAHAWADFRTSVGEGASGFSFGGAISFTLERQGTNWKIVGGHTSSPSRR